MGKNYIESERSVLCASMSKVEQTGGVPWFAHRGGDVTIANQRGLPQTEHGMGENASHILFTKTSGKSLNNPRGDDYNRDARRECLASPQAAL